MELTEFCVQGAKALDWFKRHRGEYFAKKDWELLGIEVPIASVALGACVIEKHFTLDRKMKGPDHSASLEPNELRDMVQGIRNIEKALGSSSKSHSDGSPGQQNREDKRQDKYKKHMSLCRNPYPTSNSSSWWP